MKTAIIILLGFTLFGCSIDPRDLNGRYVIDSDGRIFKVESGFGKIYFLFEVETTDLDKIRGK